MKKRKMGKRGVLKKNLPILLEKAGISSTVDNVSERLFKVAVIFNTFISLFLIYFYAAKGYGLTYILVTVVFVWTLLFAVLFLFLWLIFYLFIDVKIYQRKIGIESVFPDFLQLTSANIRAGMPIDQALWHAIRPNFGVLAKEMEDVAKQTMSGTDLEKALQNFGEKYESLLIKRSISLLIEGLNAGGEIGELLDRIATNIQESRMMQKEMAASVTTYAIFISVAAIAAAPFLLALSSQLLVIIQNIISTIDIPSTGSQFAISFSEVSVKSSDFKIFAVLTLTITSILSSSIVSVIRKGTVKAGVKYIFMFVFTSVLLFFILDKILGKFMSGVF